MTEIVSFKSLHMGATFRTTFCECVWQKTEHDCALLVKRVCFVHQQSRWPMPGSPWYDGMVRKTNTLSEALKRVETA